MPSKEENIAAELDRARRRCNLEYGDLAAVVADYFALGASEASSDDGDVGKLFVDMSTCQLSLDSYRCDSDITVPVHVFVHIINNLYVRDKAPTWLVHDKEGQFLGRQV